MITPIIHINGSAPANLKDSYDNAMYSLRDFTAAWERVEFNSRDYYVHEDPNAFKEAQLERAEMSENIRLVGEYINTIRESLDGQSA